MVINTTKIKPKYIQIVITMSLLFIVGVIRWGGISLSIDTNLLILSWVNNVAFVSQIVLHKKVFRNYFNPFTLFSVLLFLFSSGQLVLYSFGIKIIEFNIFQRLDLSILLNSIQYIILGFSFFQTGFFLFIKGESNNDNFIGQEDTSKQKIILNVGWLFLFIGILPYFVYLFHSLVTTTEYGYSAYYKQEGMRLSNVILGVGYYFFTGLILIAVGGRNSHRKFSIICLLFVSFVRLATGDRGDGFVLILAAYMLYTGYFQKGKVKKWQVLLVALFVMSLIPIISVLRKNTPVNIFAIMLENNILTGTLSTLGGTIWPLAKVMEIIPSHVGYTFGGSYIAGLLLLIPSFFRDGIIANITSNSIYSSPANWLMNYLGMTYGPGFTPFAESYMNFGWFGLALMSLYGVISYKLLSMKPKHISEMPLMFGLSILAFIFFAMGARGSFNYTISFYFRYILLPLLLTKYLLRRAEKNIRRRQEPMIQCSKKEIL